ncbi:hypothetical protein CBR_g49549 [Chara braunii]|uniref:Calcium load-activated calcium channel n=1 Tax=Chara braunii TaxID=69332 RepID=A0A388M579_CHABU|nr:hypothetical protein CBR_g49549 [Chara braunii]|eukprot:GBG89696.1 hypothetical protein CBR_g49549 [Chara braunii]
MKYADGLIILAISFASTWFCEGVSWILIYRTAGYKSLRSSIDKTSKKLEIMKSSSTAAAGKKSRSRKMDRFESSLKNSNRDLSMAKLKSGAVVAVTMVILYGFLNTMFEGKTVAKIPFEPFNFVQRMSHRGLPGNDPTDCSMAFLYFLCSLAIRSNLQKLLGFAPPRSAAGASMWAVPEGKSK